MALRAESIQKEISCSASSHRDLVSGWAFTVLSKQWYLSPCCLPSLGQSLLRVRLRLSTSHLASSSSVLSSSAFDPYRSFTAGLKPGSTQGAGRLSPGWWAPPKSLWIYFKFQRKVRPAAISRLYPRGRKDVAS